MPTVALFGTSADPPTVGHRFIVQSLAQRYDHVAVWAADNPFKKNQTPLVHRQAMLALMVDAIISGRFLAQTQALGRIRLEPELSDLRSLHSVQTAQRLWPNAELTLVIGTDVLQSFLSWYRVDELIQQVKFLVIPRPGADNGTDEIADIRAMGGRLTIADFCGPMVSSSDFRQRQQLDAIPLEVLAYIQHHGLYPKIQEKSPILCC